MFIPSHRQREENRHIINRRQVSSPLTIHCLLAIRIPSSVVTTFALNLNPVLTYTYCAVLTPGLISEAFGSRLSRQVSSHRRKCHFHSLSDLHCIVKPSCSIVIPSQTFVASSSLLALSPRLKSIFIDQAEKPKLSPRVKSARIWSACQRTVSAKPLVPHWHRRFQGVGCVIKIIINIR